MCAPNTLSSKFSPYIVLMGFVRFLQLITFISLNKRLVFLIETKYPAFSVRSVLKFCVLYGWPRRRWVDNIRMGLQEVGCGYMDWIGLAQDRDGWWTLVSAVMNLRVPWNAGNFLTSCKPVSCSRRTLHHGGSKYVRVTTTNGGTQFPLAVVGLSFSSQKFISAQIQ